MRKSIWRILPPVTMTLFVLTVAIYLLQILFDGYLILSSEQPVGIFYLVSRFINGPSIQSLVLLGGGVDSLFLSGEWYRAFTPIFLHASLMHIFSNMLTLVIVGPFVEKLFGKGKFLLVYLITGVWGNLLTFIFDPNPNVVSVGASGALFGLFGVMIVSGWYNRNNFVFRRQLIIFASLAAFNLIGNLNDPSVDIWAHIGGLISGSLLAIVFDFPTSVYGRIKQPARILAVILLLLPVAYFAWRMRIL